MLPNFNECWWDSIILDILACNWFGETLTGFTSSSLAVSMHCSYVVGKMHIDHSFIAYDLNAKHCLSDRVLCIYGYYFG